VDRVLSFYLQASIVEKGVSRRDYHLARWDVVLGCVVTDVVAFVIVVACAATLFKSGHGEINDAAEAAVALKPFAGLRSSWPDSMAYIPSRTRCGWTTWV
jgi:Mn2+/Fe2+ NRAMP family transporter